jgi:hypothetical protein
MPEISRFYGIIIYIYYREHGPSHFHAVYSGQEALISIENLSILSGSLPARAQNLAMEWAKIHKQELLDNWNKAVNHEKLDKIAPLK